MARNDMRKNGAGYRDDTAFRAISNVIREERKAKKRDNNNLKNHRADRNGGDIDSVSSRNPDGSDDARKLDRDNR